MSVELGVVSRALFQNLKKTVLDSRLSRGVSTGPNSPVTPEQVHQTIVKLKQMANQFGIPVDKVTEQLAKYIPAVIDKATDGLNAQQAITLR